MAASYDGSIRINTKLNTQGFNTGINSMMKSLGKLAAAVGIAFSVAALVNFGKQAVDLASDLQEVDNVVSKSFGNMRSEMDALANSAVKNLGMSKLTAYQTGSTFMAMGKSMVDSVEDAKNMALELTKLTGNMSSFYNVKQDIASTALKSIYTGETETLKQFGVVMTETNLKQFALEQGIQKQISAMTQSEKVMLRYKYVTEQLSFIGNDFLDTQNSWANQTRILSEQWKELLSILGGGLISVLTPVVQWLNNIVSALINVANMIGQIMSSVFGIQAQKFGAGEVEDAYAGIAGSAGAAADATDEYGNAVEKAGKKAKGALAAFDDLNVLQQNQSSGSGTASGGSGSGIGNIKTEPLEATDGFVGKLNPKIQKLIDMLGPLRDALSELWNEGLKQLMDFSGKTLEDFYHNFLKPVGTWALSEDGLPRLVRITNELLKGINWNKLRSSLSEFYKQLARLTILIFDSLLDFYDYFLKPIAQWTINKGLVTLLDILTDFSKKINWELINKGLEAFYKVLAKFAIGIGDGLLSFLKVAYELISPALAGIINLLAAGFEALFNALLLIPDGVLEALGGALGGMLSVIITYQAATGIMDALKTAWTGLYCALDDGLKVIASHPYVAIAAGIAAIIGAVVAFEDAVKEREEIALYGKTVSDLAVDIEQSAKAIRDRVDASKEYVEDAGIAEMAMAEDLAKKYYDLAEKENISNSEKELMKEYASELVELIPELSSQIDSETGYLSLQKDEMYKLIEAQKEYYRLQAAKEQLVDAYKTQLDAEKSLRESSDLTKEAQERYNDALADYRAQTEEYYNHPYDFATPPDYQSVHNAKEAWEELAASTDEAQSAYDKAQESIEYLNGVIEESNKKLSDSKQYGENYPTGLAEGINSSADLAAKAATSMTESVNEATASGLDEHSPSKVAYGFGEFYVQGFNNGIIENASTTNDTIAEWVSGIKEQMSVETWGEVFLGMQEAFTTTLDTVIAGWDERMSAWWEESVYPWFSEENWCEMLEEYQSAITTSLEDTISEWDNLMAAWWDTSVMPYYEITRWQTLGENMRKGLYAGMKGMVIDTTNLLNMIIKAFEEMANEAVESVNSIIEGYNKIAKEIGKSPVSTVGSVKLSRIPIPKLAQGAVIPPNNQFLAILGDQTSGKNIEAPASLIKDMVKEGLSEVGANAGMAAPATINLYLNGDKFAQAAVPDILAELRRSGYDLEPIGG